MKNEDSDQDLAPASLREFVWEYLQGLADLQFRSILTTRMLPTIYVLGIVLSALACISLVANGFQGGFLPGLAWLLILGPAAFLALVTLWRIILELCFAFFQLLYMLQNMSGVVDRISGQTDQIGDVVEQVSTDLPRITFWRSRKRAP
ncbi:MAG: DUF4282 domain-containing protein [Nevskiales bacterium]